MSLNALIVFQGWTGARGNWLQNDTLGYLCMVVGTERLCCKRAASSRHTCYNIS